ncbi:MAG: hypothetical protein M1832_002711 [Thelocarpon impressellum]|nr:MAG: hypothetical protein M1832_002711 [Thelocarpon impressellum]
MPPNVNPATGQRLSNRITTTQADIDSSIRAASDAFLTWSVVSPVVRSRILLKAVKILRDRNDELAESETLDTGKPFSETSTVDVTTGADVLEYYANLVGADGLSGETTQLREDAWIYTRKEALGVCVGIGAWNYPLQIALWKSAPCLAAGNTMVYKPSELTPLHGRLLANIYAEAGLPQGVFNVVHGDGSVGAYLTSHPEVAKVSFTGQVSTGKKVAAAAGAGMKYTTMELGGKSPLLVLPDADLDNAVDGAMMANFFSTGQVCTNGTRVFVPYEMLDNFHDRLLEKMDHIRTGDPMDPSVNFGPLVSKEHHDKVVGYIEHGRTEDEAYLLYGGGKPSGLAPRFREGYWVQPTVFTHCTDEMMIVKEEIFGPVMAILPYTDVDEAVRRANATPLGLAAGVFTKDLNLAHKTIARLQAGITWINTWGESPAEMSVGGWKQSGLGVENGRRGLEAWVRTKSTLVDMSGKVATVFAPR